MAKKSKALAVLDEQLEDLERQIEVLTVQRKLVGDLRSAVAVRLLKKGKKATKPEDPRQMRLAAVASNEQGGKVT